MREQRHSVRDDIKTLWYQVQIEIGIGRHPRTAVAIAQSVGYTRGKPDSRAAGRCARSRRAPSMPRPRRLARRLVLHLLGAPLNPPRPGDRAAMSAAQAWRDTGPDSPFTRYRLLLARYSAALPTWQNANGTQVPQHRGVLAWLIYGQPRTPIAGCGGWSLDAFNARTGRMMTFAGSSGR